MDEQVLFNFDSDISKVIINQELNNPFSSDIPEISKIATQEFQKFIASVSHNWNYDFRVRKGKMFGTLVVQKKDLSFAYLGTVSGQLHRNTKCERFVPSIFDESVGDYFINKGMTEVTEICNQINNASSITEINSLKEKRKQKSKGLQKRLFENYHFLNLSGKKKNLLDVFDLESGNPPSGAGDCAAPRLLQYAILHDLKPIAISEFWWGNPLHNNEREHKTFYPACKDKCKPILEYMLEDDSLYDSAKL